MWHLKPESSLVFTKHDTTWCGEPSMVPRHELQDEDVVPLSGSWLGGRSKVTIRLTYSMAMIGIDRGSGHQSPSTVAIGDEHKHHLDLHLSPLLLHDHDNLTKQGNQRTSSRSGGHASVFTKSPPTHSSHASSSQLA